MVSSKTLCSMLSKHFKVFSYFSYVNGCHENSAWAVEKILKNDEAFYFCSLMTGGDMPRFFQELMEPVVSVMSSKHRISTRLLSRCNFSQCTCSAPSCTPCHSAYLQVDILANRNWLNITRCCYDAHPVLTPPEQAPSAHGSESASAIHHSQKMKALAKTVVG